MREFRRKKRRYRWRGGCSTGIFKFIIFLLAVVMIAYFAARSYLGSDIADKIKKTQYPIKYEYFVEKYSAEYDLDKYLVYAVIRTESRFDKYAVSTAGAKGLMQLTDETGEDCARKLKLDGYSANALFDPEVNIQLGCYYLRRLINDYKDINTALAAYNGGPGNVNKWLEDQNYIDNSGQLVNIPFEETRNYVVRINDAQEKYKNIYDDKD